MAGDCPGGGMPAPVVVRKNIKHLYIRVREDGAVLVSAPRRMPAAAIDAVLMERRQWIAAQRERRRQRALRPPPAPTLWGQPLPEPLPAPRLDALYRAELSARIPALIEHWQPRLQVQVRQWRLKRMKTLWGSCNIGAGRIWLSVELARFPAGLLEYVVVHEMTHLLERRHSPRFHRLMTQFMPDWPAREAELKAVSSH